jgi:hypothetical protein
MTVCTLNELTQISKLQQIDSREFEGEHSAKMNGKSVSTYDERNINVDREWEGASMLFGVRRPCLPHFPSLFQTLLRSRLFFGPLENLPMADRFWQRFKHAFKGKSFLLSLSCVLTPFFLL